MVETKGLGAGSYPERKEDEKDIEVIINVEYGTKITVNKSIDVEYIFNEIKANLNEYIRNSEILDWEAEING